jgi:hypothetical protein
MYDVNAVSLAFKAAYGHGLHDRGCPLSKKYKLYIDININYIVKIND